MLNTLLKRLFLFFGMVMILTACQSQAPIPDSTSASASALVQDDTYEYLFENGLKLIIKEDHRAPVVVSQIWYKVGASYEPEGVTGVSHVLEHMMFKGTKKYQPGEFSRIIAENGGRENAFTGQDYTAYFQRLEADRLELSFKLESDRMRNLILVDAEFQKELRVVMEERRLRTDDKPQSATYEQFSAAAYTHNPYRNPVIGWMSDLEQMELDDLAQWYAKWYAPNNATLVVVGDVKADAVHRLAKRYFASIPSSNLGSIKPRLDPPQLGERRIRVKVPAKLPYVLMGYKVPVLHTAQDQSEAYALEVLAGVLGSGSSSRLTREMVRGSAIAADASMSYSLYGRLSSLLLLDGTPAPGHEITEIESALRDQIERMRTDLVSEDELNRVKAQVLADTIYEQDSGFYQAMLIGRLETVGLDWRIGKQYLDGVKAVTPEHIRQVAKKYLVDTHLTVAVLEPQAVDPSTKRPARAAGGSRGH